MRNMAKAFVRMFVPNEKNNYKPHILRPRNLFKLAIILLVIKFIVFSIVYYFPQTTHFAVVVSSELVELANRDRINAGLKPLAENEQLVQAAQKKALDMLNKDYFAHTSPNGLTPWYWLDKVGYKYSAAGENLAKDFIESEYVHEAWMDSSSHKANILNKNYSDIGIAVVEGEINGEKTILAVQFFGKGSAKVSGKLSVNQPKVETKTENKIEIPQQIQLETTPNIRGEEAISLKGPQVFAERRIVTNFSEEPKTIVNVLAKKSEPIAQKIYIIVLGIISLVLMLSIFINFKVQYPKMILMALIFIILIAAIALFNGGDLLNKGIDII